jgi:hypothetical protein
MAAGEGSGATGNSARLGLVRIRDGLGKGRVVAVACWTDWGRGGWWRWRAGQIGEGEGGGERSKSAGAGGGSSPYLIL